MSETLPPFSGDDPRCPDGCVARAHRHLGDFTVEELSLEEGLAGLFGSWEASE